MVGLGRMGANMARRLLAHGHDCIVFDRDAKPREQLAEQGATAAASLQDLAARLAAPRHVWLMLPSGAPTEQTIGALSDHLSPGDTIVDGGNTFFKDDVRRARGLIGKGIDLVDVGTSGGVWGFERGYCLMIGGPDAVVQRLGPVFRSLAPGEGDIAKTPGRDAQGTAEQGFLHCGPSGAGHFVKMVHNGIEYGLMQAYAEGFDLLRSAGEGTLGDACPYDFAVADIAELWRRGSVVGSWLLDLTAAALAKDPALQAYTGQVADSGEGRWTVDTAVEMAVPAHVLTAALYARFRSRQGNTFGEKMLSAMRHQFGGHTERPQP
jgi:6-phosphogluconate dehydrogenase